MPNTRAIKISRNQIYCNLLIELRARILPRIFKWFWIPKINSTSSKPSQKTLVNFSFQKQSRNRKVQAHEISFDHPCHLKSKVHFLRPMHSRERHLTTSNDAATYCFPLKLCPICLQQTQKRGRLRKLLVFNVTPFKIDRNKNQNRSIDKAQNLVNERRYMYKGPFVYKISEKMFYPDL